jgi:peptidoglycan/xylan/chitin deacetylase (PgdA/CDA1 family)
VKAERRRAMNWIVWRRNHVGVATSAAAAIAVMLVLSGSVSLYATRVSPGKGGQLASPEIAGSFAEIIRGPRGKNEVALTFDAGAEAECFDDLITALANAHASSTFFITGRFVQDHADCAVEITRHAHEIGNHTWSHLNLTEQSDDVVRDEILRAERVIFRVSGQSPRPRFRAPYAIRDERVLKIARNLGYRLIQWTLDSIAKSSQFLIDRITSKSDADLDCAKI